MDSVWFFVILLVGFVAGMVLGLDLGGEVRSQKYIRHISICDANNFTYQKCGELYGWEIK